MSSETAKLVAAWVAFHRSSAEPLEQDPNFWAATEMIELAHEEPEECWRLVLAILMADPSDATLGNLAAGPVEDLLWLHGDRIIDRIEAQAAADPVFKSMLAGVWAYDLRSDLRSRLERASGRT